MDTRLFGQLCVLLIVNICAIKAQREICYTTDTNPYIKFGTKTPYEFVKGRSSYSDNYIPNCDPVLFWSLNRHGVTYANMRMSRELPRLEDVKNLIIENYEVKHTAPSEGRLCLADIQGLKSWRWNQSESQTGTLSGQGYWDTGALARTWRTKYQQLFETNPNNYEFHYIEDPKARQSYQAFAEGLFGSIGNNNLKNSPNERNLRPYLQCPAWSRQVDMNNATSSQVYIYKAKEEYNNMLSNISMRLGFHHTLDGKTIEMMYEMCRLNKAWDISKASPWCAAFTRQDLERFEYVEDLKSYYKAGYGSPQNKELGCTMIKDLLEYFSKYIEHPDQQTPKVKVQFTESAMILMTLTALGAFENQTPLTGDNYHYPLIQKRIWRTSNMDPFNANIVAVLYKCRFNQDPYKVMFYANEQPIELKGCQVGLCDWQYVRSYYGHIADACTLSFCDRSASSGVFASFILVGIIVLIGKLF